MPSAWPCTFLKNGDSKSADNQLQELQYLNFTFKLNRGAQSGINRAVFTHAQRNGAPDCVLINIMPANFVTKADFLEAPGCLFLALTVGRYFQGGNLLMLFFEDIHDIPGRAADQAQGQQVSPIYAQRSRLENRSDPSAETHFPQPNGRAQFRLPFKPPDACQ